MDKLSYRNERNTRHKKNTQTNEQANIKIYIQNLNKRREEGRRRKGIQRQEDDNVHEKC